MRPAIGIVLAAALAAAPAAGQDVRREIERDVWIPFLAASDRFDAAGFLAVQSPDLIRVSADRREIYGLARYAAEIGPGFERARGRGIARRTTVRFLDRASAGDLAWETGYFRSEVRLADGSVRVSFTRFEFVLRREAGVWKILLDKDTSAGALDEGAFAAAAPMVSAAPPP